MNFFSPFDSQRWLKIKSDSVTRAPVVSQLIRGQKRNRRSTGDPTRGQSMDFIYSPPLFFYSFMLLFFSCRLPVVFSPYICIFYLFFFLFPLSSTYSVSFHQFCLRFRRRRRWRWRPDKNATAAVTQVTLAVLFWFISTVSIVTMASKVAIVFFRLEARKDLRLLRFPILLRRRLHLVRSRLLLWPHHHCPLSSPSSLLCCACCSSFNM